MNRTPLPTDPTPRRRHLLAGLTLASGLLVWGPVYSQSATPALQTPSLPTPALQATAPAMAVAPIALDAPVVLLGEVHDHPQQHAMRAEAFA